MNRFSAAARWISPASIFCHSLREIVRGMMSSGQARSMEGRRAILLVVDREGDAHGLDGQLGGLLPHGDLVAVHLRQVAHERAARGAGAAAGTHEFVVEAGRGV